MQKAKVELVKFQRGIKKEERHVFEYSVEHNNGKTSVEQVLRISSQSGLFEPKWIATVDLSDFPSQQTPEAAAKKLADWLERLSISLKNGIYSDFTESEYIDLEPPIEEEG